MIDTSGFIIVHPDWITDINTLKASDVEKIHISSKESGIAKSLIDGGIMVEEQCTNYEKIHDQHYWRVR